MATEPKPPKPPKPPGTSKPTGIVNFKNLEWYATSPAGGVRPPPVYATAGVFIYEKTFDPDGKVSYRRALWKAVLERSNDLNAWRNSPAGIWSPISNQG